MPPLLRLADALTLTRAGMALTAWACVAVGVMTVLAIPVALLGSNLGGLVPALGSCLGIVLVVAGLVAAAGLMTGFIGRCRCFACPEEFPRARAAARLAVILECCGCLHVVSCVLALVFTGMGGVSLPWWVPVAGFALAAVLLVAGWAFFVVFCFRLAEIVNETEAPTALLRSLPFSFAASALIVGGAFAYLWALIIWPLAVGLMGGWGLVVGSALHRLAAACERFAPPPEEE